MTTPNEIAFGGSPPQRGVTAAWWTMLLLTVPMVAWALGLQDNRDQVATFFGLHVVDRAHFLFGGIALLIGPFAFRRIVLRERPSLHRRLGKVYMVSAAVSGLSGLAMAFGAAGGVPGRMGFGGLAVVWLSTTGFGFVAIRRRDIAAHRRWMVRSFAVCFAAVTFRIELLILTPLLGFETAYPTVAWSSWVLNLAFAEYWLSNTSTAGRWSRAHGTA